MKTLAAILTFFIVHITYGQVVNDDCANAISITPSSSCITTSGTLLGAATSAATNACSGNRDVFYKFNAVASTGTIQVAGSAGLDVVASLMTSCSASTSLYCADSYGNGGTETINMSNLIIGSTYYIKVQAYNLTTPSTYTFTICVTGVSVATPPANDEYTNAITLSAVTSCSPVLGTLQNATTSTMPSLCYGNSDVFYKFTAMTTSTTVNVTGAPALDVVVNLFSVYGVSMYCANDFGAGGTETINATGLYPGTTYYIQVRSYGAVPAISTFNICVLSTGIQAPVNDECFNAINLTTSTSCTPFTGTLLNATTSQASPGCYGINDVFYKFTATATSATVNVIGSPGLDAVVGVYSNCGSNAIACADNTYSGGTETINLTGLIVGSVYYIKVQAYNSTTPTTSTFVVCVQSAYTVIPSNDNCSAAISLIPSPVCNPVSGTLLNATYSAIPNSCTSNNDVFYSFEATAETATISVVPDIGMDIAVGVFESCSGANINCTDAQITGGSETISLSDLITGNSYIIQVQNVLVTTTANAGFTICVIGASPPKPINDECSNATTIYPDPVYNPVSGTVKYATISTTTPSCTGNSDVFYKFTAVAKTATIKVVGSSGLDPVIGIFRSCSSSYMDCADFDYNTGGTEILTPTNLTIGATYYIKVQDYSNTLPTTFTFTISVQSTPVSTDVNDSEFLQQISLFPNPTQNILNVSNIQTETTIELIDTRGRVVFQKNISSDEQIDLSEFAAGVYILKLSVNGVVENRRVVVSR